MRAPRAGRTLHLWRRRSRQLRTLRPNHQSLGCLIQSDEGETVPANPAQWVYSVTKREPSREEFLINSAAATSVCQRSLADSLGGKTQRIWCGTQVSHWTSVHNDRQRDDLLAHTRWCQRCGRLSQCAQEHWTAKINHTGWTSVRQRQHHHVPQHRWNETQRVHWTPH